MDCGFQVLFNSLLTGYAIFCAVYSLFQFRSFVIKRKFKSYFYRCCFITRIYLNLNRRSISKYIYRLLSVQSLQSTLQISPKSPERVLREFFFNILTFSDDTYNLLHAYTQIQSQVLLFQWTMSHKVNDHVRICCVYATQLYATYNIFYESSFLVAALCSSSRSKWEPRRSYLAQTSISYFQL